MKKLFLILLMLACIQVNAMAVFGSDHKELTQTEITQSTNCLDITAEAINLDSDFVYLSMRKPHLSQYNITLLKYPDYLKDNVDFNLIDSVRDKFFKDQQTQTLKTLTEVVNRKFNIKLSEVNYSRMSIVYDHPLIPSNQMDKRMYLFDDVPIGYFHGELKTEKTKVSFISYFRETTL